MEIFPVIEVQKVMDLVVIQTFTYPELIMTYELVDSE